MKKLLFLLICYFASSTSSIMPMKRTLEVDMPGNEDLMHAAKKRLDQ